MPGNYTITSRSNGESIDAAKYLADHQQHVDNLEPPKVDDFSASVSEMQTTADPGELGSESQATSLAGELSRLRFTVKEIKGTAQWYQTAPTDLASLAQALNPLELTNKTGGTVSAGDVVGIDEGNDAAVKLVDTQTALWPLVVARETILNNAAGTFAMAGRMSVLTTGAVTRGHFLRKSATSKALETTGVAMATGVIPPLGAVAVALAAAAGPGAALLDTVYFGRPEPVGLTPAFTAVQLGTNPAAAGAVRLANAVNVSGRNAANSADVVVASVDSSDRVRVGPGSAGNIRMDGQVRCDIDTAARLVLPVGTDKWAV
jgi:hypothetical protein